MDDFALLQHSTTGKYLAKSYPKTERKAIYKRRFLRKDIGARKHTAIIGGGIMIKWPEIQYVGTAEEPQFEPMDYIGKEM